MRRIIIRAECHREEFAGFVVDALKIPALVASRTPMILDRYARSIFEGKTGNIDRVRVGMLRPSPRPGNVATTKGAICMDLAKR